MYVVPAARGRGVARAVLAGLEDAARDRGWTTLRLETGPRQPEAIGLYTRAGYRPIAAFGELRGRTGRRGLPVLRAGARPPLSRPAPAGAPPCYGLDPRIRISLPSGR